jgi:hypothetical protein
MKRSLWLLVVAVLVASAFGCSKKESKQPEQVKKVESKVVLPDAGKDKELAVAFLQGAQAGDKTKMYQACNLTQALVDDSRDKIIHPAKFKQTPEQRKESEHLLRMSGEIDFFAKKIKKILPKGAGLQVTQTTVLPSTTGDTRSSDHTVKVTYGSLAVSISDKKGKAVKEMVIHLQQNTWAADGRWMNEFSFDSKGFDRYADKDYEVLSYY